MEKEFIEILEALRRSQAAIRQALEGEAGAGSGGAQVPARLRRLAARFGIHAEVLSEMMIARAAASDLLSEVQQLQAFFWDVERKDRYAMLEPLSNA